MLSDLAQRLSDCSEISSERLEAVAIYLNRKLMRHEEEKRAVSLVAYKTIRIVEETLRIRDAKYGTRERSRHGDPSSRTF